MQYMSGKFDKGRANSAKAMCYHESQCETARLVHNGYMAPQMVR